MTKFVYIFPTKRKLNKSVTKIYFLLVYEYQAPTVSLSIGIKINTRTKCLIHVRFQNYGTLNFSRLNRFQQKCRLHLMCSMIMFVQIKRPQPNTELNSRDRPFAKFENNINGNPIPRNSCMKMLVIVNRMNISISVKYATGANASKESNKS